MKGELTTGFGSNSISLRDGAGAMFRRKALVLLTFLTVVLGTAVVTLLLPNKYESRMKILVKNQRVDVAITPEATAGAPPVESEVSDLLFRPTCSRSGSRRNGSGASGERPGHRAGEKGKHHFRQLLNQFAGTGGGGPKKAWRSVFRKAFEAASSNRRL